MSDSEVVRRLGDGSSLDNARKVFSSACGSIEQKMQQAGPPLGAVELRRLEFEAVRRIAYCFGVVAL